MTASAECVLAAGTASDKQVANILDSLEGRPNKFAQTGKKAVLVCGPSDAAD